MHLVSNQTFVVRAGPCNEVRRLRMERRLHAPGHLMRPIAHRHVLAALTTLATLQGFAATTWACGASPEPYVTLGATLPDASTGDVSPDTVILVAAQGFYAGTLAEATWSLPSLVTVDVRPHDASGGALHGLPGKVVSWGESAVFVPDAPLAANTTYDVVATTHNTTSIEEGNPQAGADTSTSSFTTGSTALAPLAFGGDPAFTFEDRDHEVCGGPPANNCGTCPGYITQADRTIVVSLPAPSGGDPIGGFSYYATATLSAEDRGEPGFTVGLSSVATRVPSELLVPLFSEPQPYGVCVTIDLRDARGTTVTSTKRCFTKEVVWATSPADSGNPTGGSGGSASSPSTPSGGASGSSTADVKNAPPVDDETGCSLAAPRSSTASSSDSGAMWALLAAIALVSRSARSRKRASHNKTT